MSEISTLTVRIASALVRELEARAQRAHFTVDELVTQMISASLFRNSPEYHDPNSERARHFRMVEEGLADIARGDTVSLEDFENSCPTSCFRSSRRIASPLARCERSSPGRSR